VGFERFVRILKNQNGNGKKRSLFSMFSITRGGVSHIKKKSSKRNQSPSRYYN
jgi:hypothetical protein